MTLNATWPSDIVQGYSYSYTGEPCERIVYGPTSVLPLFRLQQYDYTSESWFSVGSEQIGAKFENLDKGTYRVRVRLPGYYLTPGCPEGGRERALDISGRQLGYLGIPAPLGQPNGIIFSNFAIVGESNEDDLEFEFVDPGDSEPDNVYNIDDAPEIKLTGTRNFDEVFIAVRTINGTPNKYRSTGGFISVLPNSLGAPSRQFIIDVNPWLNSSYEPEQLYNVQFVAKNSGCPSPQWNQVNEPFYMCSENVSCRFNLEERLAITFYPNPNAQGIFRMKGVDNYGTDFELRVSNSSGQQIKFAVSNGSLDLSSHPKGTYFVRLFTSEGLQEVQRVVKL